MRRGREGRVSALAAGLGCAARWCLMALGAEMMSGGRRRAERMLQRDGVGKASAKKTWGKVENFACNSEGVSLKYFLATRAWRNRQTRWLQVPVGATP